MVAMKKSTSKHWIFVIPDSINFIVVPETCSRPKIPYAVTVVELGLIDYGHGGHLDHEWPSTFDLQKTQGI